MSKVYILEIKPYVYEIVNGKRKRVSPLVTSKAGDTIVKIHERGIVKKWVVKNDSR